MGLFEKGKKEDDIKHVLDVLSINIESINKRLSFSQKDSFPEDVLDNINKILSTMKYVYSYLNLTYTEIQKLQSKQDIQTKKIDETMQLIQNLAKNDAINERFDYLEERFSSVLALLKEENKIIKEQNEILQRMER